MKTCYISVAHYCSVSLFTNQWSLKHQACWYHLYEESKKLRKQLKRIVQIEHVPLQKACIEGKIKLLNLLTRFFLLLGYLSLLPPVNNKSGELKSACKRNNYVELSEEHGEVNKMCTGPAVLKISKFCLLRQLS